MDAVTDCCLCDFVADSRKLPPQGFAVSVEASNILPGCDVRFDQNLFSIPSRLFDLFLAGAFAMCEVLVGLSPRRLVPLFHPAFSFSQFDF